MSESEPQVGDLVDIRSNERAWLFTERPADGWAGVTFPAEAHAGSGVQIKLREGRTGRVIDIDTNSAGSKRYWVHLPEYKSHTPLWARQIRTIVREVPGSRKPAGARRHSDAPAARVS